MSSEPLHLTMRVILEVNAALVAGHKAAKTLYEQHGNTLGYSPELHRASMTAHEACIAFDVWVVRKLPTIEMTVAE